MLSEVFAVFLGVVLIQASVKAQSVDELDGNVLGSASSEFFVAFGRNELGGPPTLRLFITSIEPDPVPITIETLRGFSFTGIATPNTTTTVEIPSTFQANSSLDIDKGIRVSAGDKRIVVYGLNYHVGTSDAYLALPCDSLPVEQYEYYAISYTGGGFGLSHILIVSCEDNTVVQIGSAVVHLNRMQTYFFEDTDDVTGTKVVSNNPIVVYPGHECTNIPNTVPFCDHITEQVPPTVIWGSQFISASFNGRLSGEIYRVLASEDATTVVVNCSTSSQLQTYDLSSAGSWQEFTTPAMSFCSIDSNKPLLVMEFGLGYNLDQIGDPFMMMVTPTEQFSNNYVFNVLPEFSTNYITVAVTSDDFEPRNIHVDDVDLENAVWNTVYCSDTTVCGYVTYVTLAPGQHRLYHSDVSAHIGVSAYGFNRANSYGYPGGLELVPLQRKDVFVNDSVIGDPQFTVSLPVNGSRHMCYEVHGVAGQFFNLISDTCTSVNALFAAMPGNVRINRMSSIGIHAVTTATPSGSCADIQIDLENCTATLNGASIDGSTIINDIRVRKFGNRWRVSVPNCERPSAVMWITCQRNPDMLRFDIARGSNLRPTSHGLLGQFWNIPITITEGDDGPYVEIYSPGADNYRRIPAFEYHLTWDHSRKRCYYVGNSQGGPELSHNQTESVIQGYQSQYQTAGLFETTFDYEMFDETVC